MQIPHTKRLVSGIPYVEFLLDGSFTLKFLLSMLVYIGMGICVSMCTSLLNPGTTNDMALL